MKGRLCGFYTVQKRAPNRKGETMWFCKCICGKITPVSGSDLRARACCCGCMHRNHDRLTNPVEYDIWKTAKYRAKAKNIPFSLQLSDISVPLVCPILGIPLAISKGVLKDNSPSIDRVYPDKGYVPGNILIVSFKANRLKNELNPEELVKLGLRFRELWESANGITR